MCPPLAVCFAAVLLDRLPASGDGPLAPRFRPVWTAVTFAPLAAFGYNAAMAYLESNWNGHAEVAVTVQIVAWAAFTLKLRKQKEFRAVEEKKHAD